MRTPEFGSGGDTGFGDTGGGQTPGVPDTDTMKAQDLRRPQWLLAGAGGAAAVAAAAASPDAARAAASQTWPAFALVAGLLLVGLVAHEDGLFDTAGHALARFAPNGWALYAGSALLVRSARRL